MKFKQIGVWFSLALAIFVLSGWLGSELGTRVALYQYRSAQHRSLGRLNAAEHAHLESVLDELETIGLFRMVFLVSMNDDKIQKSLPEELGRLESFERRVNTAEAKPVADMNLALANVVAAIVDERSHNKEQAAIHMRTAQSLFQSLGWRECSEGTLRALAQRELDHWKLEPRSSGRAK